jgi:hypothetical protein
MPEFNLPDKDDPDFNNKVVSLLDQLFNTSESNIKNLDPIKDPEEGLQIGSMWFDETLEKIKVNTSTGIKVLKYE